MENFDTKNIVNDYKVLLGTMQVNNIEAATFGFVNNNCDTMLFSILIHCMENIGIFNEDQVNNINNLINKIVYG